MTDQYLRIHGTIRKVWIPEYLTKENNPHLVSPEVIGLTRTHIDRGLFEPTSIELFGEFGRNYVGREITLYVYWNTPSENPRRFRQEIFIDGKLEVDKELVIS